MDKLQAFFRKPGGGQVPPASAGSLDPFGKASFDALLQTLDEIENPSDITFTDGKDFIVDNTFPGFDALGVEFEFGTSTQHQHDTFTQSLLQARQQNPVPHAFRE